MSSSAAINILSHIKSLELQIKALRFEVENLIEQENEGTHTFADLYGMTKGQWNLSEEDIDATLYQLPPEFENEITSLPKE